MKKKYIDKYFMFKVNLKDADYTVYNTELIEKTGKDDLLEDLSDGKLLLSYNTPYHLYGLDKGKIDYSMEYITKNNELALMRFCTNIELDGLGVVYTTLKSDDCMFFITDHQGTFRVFLYKNNPELKKKVHDGLTNLTLRTVLSEYINN